MTSPINCAEIWYEPNGVDVNLHDAFTLTPVDGFDVGGFYLATMTAQVRTWGYTPHVDGTTLTGTRPDGTRAFQLIVAAREEPR